MLTTISYDRNIALFVTDLKNKLALYNKMIEERSDLSLI